MLAFLLAIGAGLFLGAGCEDEPSADAGAESYFDNNPFSSAGRGGGELPLRISPDSPTVTVIGEEIVLRVRGGNPPYRWSVASDDRGKLRQSSRTSDTATYTSLAVAENSVSVFDSFGHGVTIEVKASGANALQIIPVAVTFTASSNDAPPFAFHTNMINFRLVGGVPPYASWAVSIPVLGTIDQNGVYTLNGYGLGSNIVSVIDGAGDAAQSTIITRQQTP